MANIPDLVRLSKLETEFLPQAYVKHVKHVAERRSRRGKVQRDEIWKAEQKLGEGGFGIVRLQRCTQGIDEGSARAVKMLKKSGTSNYYRELEAIALFSHEKVCLTLIFLCDSFQVHH
jgi:hypothetical protein